MGQKYPKTKQRLYKVNFEPIQILTKRNKNKLIFYKRSWNSEFNKVK
jgi:hypothetical protein